ncbi:MAG: non-homologous end-joining DNA ligase [Vulcanimicrobiaceae bacterium]
MRIDGRDLALSNRDKVIFPRDGYTKGDLVAYYRAIAPILLPHLRDRPLTLERYPDGIDGGSFFEKNASRHLPDWIPTTTVSSAFGKRETIRFVLCNDEATLAYVANLAAIVLHVWTSHEPALDVPEFLFFDLDPFDGCTIGTLAHVALALRDALGEIGLEPVVKSSGGSGLHVAIPLVPEYSYETCRTFAEVVARTVHARLPALTTLERAPAKRPSGTVYLDFVQVGRGKTLVAPFSVRARDGAPVSMPLDWSEIEALARKRPRGKAALAGTMGEFARYTVKNAAATVAERGDLWGGTRWREQRLEPALARARSAWT